MIRAEKLFNHLQLYVKGQERALKQIATVVALHLNRCRYNRNHETKLYNKENVLIMGPTGTGKTETLRALESYPKLNCPIVLVNALQYTATGWKGNKSLSELGEEIFRQAALQSNLTELTVDNVDQVVEFAEKAIICLDEFDKRRINRKVSLDNQAFEHSYQGDLLKIMEGTSLEVEVKHIPRIYLRTDNMLFLLMGAFNGFDDKVEPNRVGFVPVSPGQTNSKCLERTSVTTDERFIEKNHNDSAITTDCLGEITDEKLIHYGFMEELVGRVPWRVRYDTLHVADLVDILKKSKHSIIREYKSLFESMGNHLEISDAAYQALAECAMTHKTGARALSTIVKSVLNSSFYDVLNDTKLLVTIDEDAVDSKQVKLEKLEPRPTDKGQNKGEN